ncbi:MAG: hypothetical protein V7L17_17680 [Nostoc sp.]
MPKFLAHATDKIFIPSNLLPYEVLLHVVKWARLPTTSESAIAIAFMGGFPKK